MTKREKLSKNKDKNFIFKMNKVFSASEVILFLFGLFLSSKKFDSDKAIVFIKALIIPEIIIEYKI